VAHERFFKTKIANLRIFWSRWYIDILASAGWNRTYGQTSGERLKGRGTWPIFPLQSDKSLCYPQSTLKTTGILTRLCPQSCYSLGQRWVKVTRYRNTKCSSDSDTYIGLIGQFRRLLSQYIFWWRFDVKIRLFLDGFEQI
jgi:hypothetical protein